MGSAPVPGAGRCVSPRRTFRARRQRSFRGAAETNGETPAHRRVSRRPSERERMSQTPYNKSLIPIGVRRGEHGFGLRRHVAALKSADMSAHSKSHPFDLRHPWLLKCKCIGVHSSGSCRIRGEGRSFCFRKCASSRCRRVRHGERLILVGRCSPRQAPLQPFPRCVSPVVAL